MSAINEQTILNCLDQVIDEKSGKSVVALGLIAGLVIKEGNVAMAGVLAAVIISLGIVVSSAIHP